MNDDLHRHPQRSLLLNRMVASHIRPDGDAIGSLLGFGLCMQAAGKKVQMVLRTGFHPPSPSARQRARANRRVNLI